MLKCSLPPSTPLTAFLGQLIISLAYWRQRWGLQLKWSMERLFCLLTQCLKVSKWSKTTWIGIYTYYFSKWMSRVNVFTQQSLCLLTDLFKLNSHSKNQSKQCWLDFYHNFAFWNCIQYTTLIKHKSYLINRKRWTLVNNSKIKHLHEHWQSLQITYCTRGGCTSFLK